MIFNMAWNGHFKMGSVTTTPAAGALNLLGGDIGAGGAGFFLHREPTRLGRW